MATGNFNDKNMSSSDQFCKLPLVIFGWQRVQEEESCWVLSLDSLEPVWVHGVGVWVCADSIC